MQAPRGLLRGYWTLEKKCPCAVPTGLRSAVVETAFPTLKRGANNHCAYGADTRTLVMQLSVKPASFAVFAARLEPCLFTKLQFCNPFGATEALSMRDEVRTLLARRFPQRNRFAGR
jgi:hypothetical protein